MTIEAPTELVEALARVLFEAAEHIPGARVPVIAAEELARTATNASTIYTHQGHRYLCSPAS